MTEQKELIRKTSSENFGSIVGAFSGDSSETIFNEDIGRYPEITYRRIFGRTSATIASETSGRVLRNNLRRYFWKDSWRNFSKIPRATR